MTIFHSDFIILQNSWSLSLGSHQGAVTGFSFSIGSLGILRFYAIMWYIQSLGILHSLKVLNIIYMLILSNLYLYLFPLLEFQVYLSNACISTWIPNGHLKVNTAKILFIRCTLKPTLALFFYISFNDNSNHLLFQNTHLRVVLSPLFLTTVVQSNRITCMVSLQNISKKNTTITIVSDNSNNDSSIKN